MKPLPLLHVGVCLLTSLACAGAADIIQPQKARVSAAGVYVPVSLEAHARDQAESGLPTEDITVRNVPFDLVQKQGANHLFVKSAEWPDWKEDPSTYYSAYDKGNEGANDPRRLLFKIPVADYAAVRLLAACDNDPALSQVVSFRIGAFDGPRRTTLHDFSAVVPRFADKRGVNATPVATTAMGNVFEVRVPLNAAIAQDFTDEWALDVEVTKELRLAVRRPDPCRYQIRPLGLPSGVRIFGMTFERSAVQMQVTSDESGHVFNEPQVPAFHVKLRQIAPRSMKLSLEAMATDFYGEATTVKVEELTFPKHGELVQDVSIPVKKRGYHELSIRLLQGRTELLRRDTTFAVLPKDTRKHRETSPFGTWDFSGTHFTPDRADVVGPLYVKAGLRYGMFGFTAEERKRYGVISGTEPRNPDLLEKALAKDPTQPKSILIFHENAISGAHIMRTPDVFTGRAPYKLDEKEQAKFEAMVKEATETAQATRAKFPDAKLAFGNGNPHLMEEFARHKFPKELFDSRGNEAGCFMRMPETQPLDFVANNAGLWMDRQILDAYGYQDKPITQCYEICYPATNPGNLSLRTQAAYFVRHAMHSLAWGIPIIRQGSITDMGNSYYYSNWGATGFCFVKPEVNPKPSYVAIATMTQQLDGAKFSRIVDMGSPVVYGVEFKKPDGSYVTVAWTLRGNRTLRWSLFPGGPSHVDKITGKVDLMGNDHPGLGTIQSMGVSMQISELPIFISSKEPLSGFGVVRDDGMPPKVESKSFTISKLASTEDWQIESEPNTELEWYNFECPRRKGDFEITGVPCPHFPDVGNVMRVKPRLPVAGSSYLPMYSVMKLKKPVEIPNQPTEIGLMVHGNGGWGRIMFELEDASGQRWTSIGAPMKGEATRWMADWMSEKELAEMKQMNVGDWNTNDPWQRSRINFEGWHFLKFPLPGNYPGEGYHWPYSSQWKHSGDGVVKYPLKFTKLIIELPEKTLQFTKYAPVPRPEIYLKDLKVTYEAPEKVFVAP
jgi:hypothetical protein